DNVADTLVGSGLSQDGAAVIDLLAAAAGADPKMGKRGERYLVLARLQKAGLDRLVEDVLTDRPGADVALQGAIKTLLLELPPVEDLFDRLQQLAIVLETSGRFAVATACF